MPKNIRLRKIKTADQPVFLKWWQDPELIGLTSGRTEPVPVLEKYFRQMLRDKKNRHYVILFNTKAIGHISLTRRSAATFEVQIIIGEKKYRGQGIGSQVIKRVMRLGFTKYGYRKAYIEVRPENHHAIEVYKKLGFIEKGVKINKNDPYRPKALCLELKRQ